MGPWAGFNRSQAVGYQPLSNVQVALLRVFREIQRYTVPHSSKILRFQES